MESMEPRAFELELGISLSCVFALSRDGVKCSQEGSGPVILDFKYELSLFRITELYTNEVRISSDALIYDLRAYFTFPSLA